MAKYQTDPVLQKIIEEYVPSGAFPEAEGRVIVALFAKGKPPDKAEAASCHKVPETLRVISGVDYYLTFWASTWINMAEDDRHVMVCHELHHIATNDDGKPSIRRHQGDFCEIPEHDKESQRIAANVTKSKNLSYKPLIEDEPKQKASDTVSEEETEVHASSESEPEEEEEVSVPVASETATAAATEG